MFEVFDSGKPATFEHHPVDHGFNKYQYDTFEEALKYARIWLGPQHGGSKDGQTGINLAVNVPHTYNGRWNDTIEIIGPKLESLIDGVEYTMVNIFGCDACSKKDVVCLSIHCTAIQFCKNCLLRFANEMPNDLSSDSCSDKT